MQKKKFFILVPTQLDGGLYGVLLFAVARKLKPATPQFQQQVE